MAYRNISVGFWSDRKVRDEFSREEKFAYLYLMTSPQTNICGCYEISKREAEIDFDMKWKDIEKLIINLERKHKVIRYDADTMEILVLKWGKYNWSKSEKLLNAVRYAVPDIKSNELRDYVERSIEAKLLGEEVQYEFSEKEVEREEKKPVQTKVTVTTIVQEKCFPAELEATVLDWIKYKVQQKKPYKEVGLRSLLTQIQKKVDEFGQAKVIEVIELSMASNWQGICWDKLKDTRPAQSNRLGGLEFYG